MLIGGHRGCGVTDSRPAQAGTPQENSLPSIEQAFALGADFVEVDWVWDAQGVGWICHSMRLSEHFNDPRVEYLDQLSTPAVEGLIGRQGAPLMSLAQLIERFGDRTVNVEIKGVKGIGRRRVSFHDQQYPKRWPSCWWLSSFDPQDLEDAQRIWPDTPVGLLSAPNASEGLQYLDGTPYLTGQQALTYLSGREHWRWHPEITHRPHASCFQVGWSLDPESESHCDLSGLQGLITDRLDAWLGTG